MSKNDLMEGRIKRIHINQHNIRHNAKASCDLKPVVTVKTSANNHKGFRAQIGDKTTLIYSPDKPLDCGAKVWIETTEEVIISSPEEDALTPYEKFIKNPPSAEELLDDPTLDPRFYGGRGK